MPDIIAFGKIIGGGFPIGAFGAREQIMRMYNPAVNENTVGHSGTFSGNAIVMAAGAAAMQHFKQKDVDRINALGDRFREKSRKMFSDAGVIGCAIGWGSIGAIGFMNDHGKGTIADNIKDFMMQYRQSIPRSSIYQLALINHGVYIANRGALAISTATTEADIDDVIVRASEALEDIRPFVLEEQEKYGETL